MVTTIVICATVILCVAIIANADVTIDINIKDNAVNTVNNAPVEDVQEVYDKLAKEEKVPNFGDVIDAINAEFGGVNYGETE